MPVAPQDPAVSTACLTTEVCADLERVLRDLEGFPSYDASRDWLWQQHGIQPDGQPLSGHLGYSCQGCAPASKKMYPM